MPPDSYWRTIREICDRYDVLIISSSRCPWPWSFGGHSVGCAVGCELIHVIRDEKLIENCNKQSPRVFSYREELLSHPTVADVRGWGLMMVLELVADGRRRYLPASERTG